MTLEPGFRLGSYEILGPLGAGGMGQVYRARDTRLQREVAIKVLPAHLAASPDARARFEQEALSVAKLSNPNILSIFEFGEQQGIAYVVTELIDGDTLRARIKAGPMPQRRTVGYALQIARGIAAAHSRGIVHRDLKPENVMITRDDHVKILDFGLAKTAGPAPGDETRVAGVQTTAGTVLGTFGYMAPEQVRGMVVDYRADMFAFGAVLYEMLSGERAFKGETAADTMTAILTKEPVELDTVRLSISPALDRIVRRCLEKSPDLRFQSANDLAFALETLSTTSTASAARLESTPATVPFTRGKAWLPWSVAAACLVLALMISLYKRRSPEVDLPWQQFTAVTEAGGVETAPTLSPDGSTVAYAIRVNGSWDIYAQRVGGRNATPIVNDPKRDEGGPAYSPDGSRIAFHESDDDGGIFIAGATGESVRRLTDIGFDPTWSPDGKQIAFSTEEVREPSQRLTISGLYVVDVASGVPRKIVEDDAIQPSWSPSNDWIAYWSNNAGQRDLFSVAAAGGPRIQLTDDAAIDWCPVWSPDGKFVYFSSDRGGAMNLWRLPMDHSTGRASGPPTPVTNGVQASSSLPSFSKDGARMALRSRVASVNPVAIPFDPATTRAGAPRVLDGSNNVRVPSDVSPDGTHIAYFSIGERQEDIFIGTADGKNVHRVTDDAARDRSAMFTRDGQSVVFYSNRDGAWAVWTVRIDGSNLRKLAGMEGGVIYPVVSPLDNTVVFTPTKSELGIFSVPFAGGPPTKLPGSRIPAGDFYPSSWSPDGAQLAGTFASESGKTSGVGVYDLKMHTATLIATDDTGGVRWLPDSRRVIYRNTNGEIIVADSVTRHRTIVSVQLPGLPMNDVFAIAPDGRTIYYGVVHAEADIWIAERK